MSCSEKPHLKVQQCDDGTISLPQSVFQKAEGDMMSDDNDESLDLTMHVEDIIMHLKSMYLDSETPHA